MKTVLLAGGSGTRIAEESEVRPKPMIEIGGMPILWHIMKLYANHGLKDFVVCLGYKGYFIKEYFSNYVLHRSDVTLDLAQNKITYHANQAEDWSVTLVDTGADTLTGGRIKRVQDYLTPGEPFCMTYGDGLSDVNIAELVEFHKQEGREATLTAVLPTGRFGACEISGNAVVDFIEKPHGEGGYINGGFFVLNYEVLERINGDDTVWELEPMNGLARDGQLSAFRHEGFWHPMDTLRDKRMLENLWSTGAAPWKCW